MANGPKGEERPADTIGCAVVVAKIATGEIDEILPERSGRVRSGLAGAKARAESLTDDRRQEIARLAAETRWAATASPRSDHIKIGDDSEK